MYDVADTYVYDFFMYIYSPNYDFSQGRGSYFCSIVIPLESRIAGCQPTCLDLPRLSSAANSLDSRIAGCHPTCIDLPRLA